MEIPKNTYNGAGVYFIRYRKDRRQRDWDDKIYIGSSIHIRQRLKQHLYQLKNGTHCGREFQADYTADPDGKWWVGVIRKMEGATEKELRAAESEEIARIPKRNRYNSERVYGSIGREEAEDQESFAKRLFRNATIREMLVLLAQEERITEQLVDCTDDPKEKTIQAAREAFEEAVKYFQEHQ